MGHFALGAGHATLTILLLAPATGQTPAQELAALHTLGEAAPTATRQRLAAIADTATRSAWIVAAGSDLLRGEPAALTGAARRDWLAAMDETAAACTAELHEWFAFAGARYLAGGSEFDAAAARLVQVASALPTTDRLRFDRTMLHVDCLLQLDRFAEAERLAGHEAPPPSTRLRQALWFAQRARIDTALGRLDRAAVADTQARELADRILASPAPDESTLASWVQFNAFLSHLDLLTAREQFDEAVAAIPAFTRARAAAGAPPTPAQQTTLALHEVSAHYHAAHHDPTRLPRAAAELDRLRLTAGLPPATRALLAIQRADVAMLLDQFTDATRLLADIDRGALPPRSRRLLVPVEARLALRTGAATDRLRDHERQLRAVLATMIQDWIEVSDRAETTGFLRLGERLRVVGELTAIAVALDGPDAGLQVVLEAQRCTTLARQRHAAAVSVDGVRSRLLAADIGALVFLPSWHVSHVFAIDADTTVHATLGDPTRWRPMLRDFRIELAALDHADGAGDEPLARIRGVARELTTQLLPSPIRQRLAAWRAVTVSGAGLLGGLPLECLEFDDGQLLGERLAVTTTWSLPLVVELARDASASIPPDRAHVRMLATLAPGREFATRNALPQGEPALPATVQQLADRAREHGPLAIGAAATVTAWRRTDAGCRGGLTLLLAHGERPTATTPPTLGLSPDPTHPDGLLTPDLVVAEPQSGVVVLSACYGSRSPGRVGDDDVAATLAGAFLAGGASAVVSSAAPLRASLHAAVAEAMLAGLVDGDSVASALQRARRQVGQDRLLAYRAGQISVSGWGGARIAPHRPPGSRWLVWSGIATAAALVLLAAWRWTVSRRARPRAAPAPLRPAAAPDTR